MKDLRGKVVVITGAGSGIGRKLAIQLSKEGANLALGDINLENLARTREMLELRTHVSIHTVDVAKQMQMAEFAAEVLAEHGQVDLLVNNAGITLTPTIFEEISDPDFERVVTVNMWGVYYGIREFLPHLQDRPEAMIVNMSSLAGLVGLYGYTPYAMSKFAIRGLTNEYLEDARIIKDGKLKIIPSLTEIEKIKFPEPWGELEAFNTAGGTSSLPDLYESKIQQLTYKTIRFPGHAQFFVFLKEFGLLSDNKYPEKPVVSPREVIEYYLAQHLPRNQPDVVLARITIIGISDKSKMKHIYELIDRYDPETDYSAMARTTAYPTSIIGQFIAHGLIKTHGVLKAEENVPANELIKELKKRNIRFKFKESQE